MRIGILTYVKSHNYGALLQAIALRNVLVKSGHKVTFIDYYPEYHQKMYKIQGVPKKLFFSHPRHFLHLLLNNICQRLRRKNFKKFQQHYINPFLSSIEDSYDIVVYGSDQIWRKQPFINSYNPMYFGKNILKTKKHISYAASADRPPLSLEEKDVFSELLSHLDMISVREQWLAQTVHELGFQAEVVLDPTLLLTSVEWEKVVAIPKYHGKKYVLFYDLLSDSFDREEVLKFAHRQNLELITIVGTAYFTRDKNIKTTLGPEQFLSLVKNADYVLTSSFHGLVFSLIFHVPFFASFSRNAQRAEALLTTIGCNDFMLQPKSVIPECRKLDFNEIDKFLCKIKQSSLKFLRYLEEI